LGRDLNVLGWLLLWTRDPLGARLRKHHLRNVIVDRVRKQLMLTSSGADEDVVDLLLFLLRQLLGVLTILQLHRFTHSLTFGGVLFRRLLLDLPQFLTAAPLRQV